MGCLERRCGLKVWCFSYVVKMRDGSRVKIPVSTVDAETEVEAVALLKRRVFSSLPGAHKFMIDDVVCLGPVLL